MTPHVLWTSAEAARATGGDSATDWVAQGISIDSRSVAPDDLFVALKGPTHDGHDFVEAALAGGAAAAMVDHRPAALPDGAPLLLVQDTMDALNGLGRAARARSNARIVGVTGSVGKTGTKEALRICLADQGRTAASAASFNNQWGVPVSLARMPRETDFGVLEMGMNHAGELRALTGLVRPHVALITTVEAVHLEFFDSVAGIADAKSEIFEGLEPDGTAIIYRDSPYYARMRAAAEACGAARILTFGRAAEADVRLIEASLGAESSQVRASVNGHDHDYVVGMSGEHWVTNSLAVLAVIAGLGADVAAAAHALSRLQPVKGRGQRREVPLAGGPFLLIDESYNANPTSVVAAIDVLGRAPVGHGGRRIAVLGDMLELGSEAAAFHVGLAESIEAAGLDLVLTCGPEMAALHAALPESRRGPHKPDSMALIEDATALVAPGDTVMVKGSLGSRMAPIVEALIALGEMPLRAANGE